MLLLKTKRNFQQVLASAFTPLVILPATKPGETRDEAKVRANDLAVTARIEGSGVTVTESTSGELFVFVSDNESQAVGFARKMVREQKTAEPWFLFLHGEKGPLLLENADRAREDCTLTETGFVLPTCTVEIIASYIPAQNNTAMGLSRGLFHGDHL